MTAGHCTQMLSLHTNAGRGLVLWDWRATRLLRSLQEWHLPVRHRHPDSFATQNDGSREAARTIPIACQLGRMPRLVQGSLAPTLPIPALADLRSQIEVGPIPPSAASIRVNRCRALAATIIW